jgi:hypothetical protein
MTDDERRAFANLILLCTPHHTIVDRLHPSDYPPDKLQRWKTERETDAGIDNLAVASLTEDRLIALIERAVDTAPPERLVTAELGLGIAMGHQLLAMPPATAKDYFSSYAEYGPAVVTLTVRNCGALRAYVDSLLIHITPAWTGDNYERLPVPQSQLAGRRGHRRVTLLALPPAKHGCRHSRDPRRGNRECGHAHRRGQPRIRGAVTTPEMPAHYLGLPT